jgi:hypothetical protein
LVHETAEASEACTGFSAQRRPGVAKDRARVAQRQERFTRHVAPPFTVARRDEAVERPLQASESALQAVYRLLRRGKQNLARKPCRAQRPAGHADGNQLRGWVAIREE